MTARSPSPLTPTVVPQVVVPLAVAFQESCNAIFKGANPADCIAKVTGEMVMSFPANFIGWLESHDQLSFKLGSMDRIRQLLHNQVLLNRCGAGGRDRC